jgi:hypothetical protein
MAGGIFVRITIITTILCIFVSFPVTAEEVIIKHKFMEGILLLRIDDRKIDPGIVKKYLVIHPVAYNPQYQIAPSISLCIEKDPRYFPCGTRDYRAKFFLSNAKINIKIGLERLQYLFSLNELKELQPLVDYFKDSLEFSLWLSQQLFKYYQSWKTEVLNQQYQALPRTKEIREALRSLESSKSVGQKWNIAHYDWANAVNNSYTNQEGDIPKEVWDNFIKKYGISEEIQWEYAPLSANQKDSNPYNLICSPSIVKKGEDITLKMSVPHGDYLIIDSPAGFEVPMGSKTLSFETTPFFVIYPGAERGSSYMNSEEFVKAVRLVINTSTLNATPWVADRGLEEVFTIPGKYTIKVGKRMETDYPEYSSCIIEYKN